MSDVENTDNDLLMRPAQVIEALIYASKEPVLERALEKHLPDGIALTEILEVIDNRYGEASGIKLTKVGQGWAFRTKPEIAALLNVEKETERPLSRAALEVLAIIAYHQPITRAEIEEIEAFLFLGALWIFSLNWGGSNREAADGHQADR